jgi:ATP-dependent Clp protease adaptor protein ClpS
MSSSSPGSASLLERQTITQRYPQARVIVLDDDVNTFQHVVDCLRKIIPGMSEEKAWGLANRIDGQGSAEVWCGPRCTTSSWQQRGSPWLHSNAAELKLPVVALLW